MLKSLDFSIIIVNYNSTQALQQAAASLAQVHQQKYTYEFIFVDNNSRKDEVSLLRQASDQLQQIIPVRTFFLSKNLGFGGANNYGAARARGDKLLFLNPDTFTSQAILGRLGRDLERAHTGLVAPRLVASDGQPQADAAGSFPTLATTLRRHSNHSVPMPSNAAASAKNGLLPVDWVSGACFAVTRAHWQEIGGFDERFFMYFEDVDLSRRAIECGLQNYIDTSIQIVHYGADRSAVTKGRRQLYFAGQDQYFQIWRPREARALRLLRFPYQVYCSFKDPK